MTNVRHTRVVAFDDSEESMQKLAEMTRRLEAGEDPDTVLQDYDVVHASDVPDLGGSVGLGGDDDADSGVTITQSSAENDTPEQAALRQRAIEAGDRLKAAIEYAGDSIPNDHPLPENLMEDIRFMQMGRWFAEQKLGFEGAAERYIEAADNIAAWTRTTSDALRAFTPAQ